MGFGNGFSDMTPKAQERATTNMDTLQCARLKYLTLESRMETHRRAENTNQY